MQYREPTPEDEIIHELRDIKVEIVNIKKQMAGSVAFGVIGAGLLVAVISLMFSIFAAMISR